MPSYDEKYAYLERHVDALKTNRTGDERQTDAEVFDKQTLLVIYDFMTAGYIDSVHYTISTGKEGNVFFITDEDDQPFALKIFRTSTSTFKSWAKYIEGDPRFKGITGNRRKLIYAWTNKEYRNLQRYKENGIRVPEPIEFEKNCLLMEYIGDKNGPAPQLKDAVLKRPNMTYKECVSFIVDGYKKAHLVHGDLSEYNILMWKDKPVLIDCGQALTADHFNSKDFLKRDIANVNRFFRHRDVDIIDDEEILARALAKDEEEDQ
ncbi:MAG: serine protein kinase RIO [Candidatus Methanomethylophilaceae archaeon]|nr:serine protein kinase RIO [Candidatus Methanomethylophilaceae archaeon]